MNSKPKATGLSSLANLLGNIYLLLRARDTVYHVDDLMLKANSGCDAYNYLLVYTAEEILQDFDILQDCGWYKLDAEQADIFCTLLEQNPNIKSLSSVLGQTGMNISTHDRLAIIAQHEELLLELKDKTNLFPDIPQSYWDMYKNYRKNTLEQISAQQLV